MRKPSVSIRKLAVLAAVTAAAAIAASLALSSSHREAPNIMLDPSADNTDVYAWTAKDAKHAITVASNWIPGQVPANGPNFFRFDDRAKYYIQFDNTGDGVADIKYLFKFNTRVRNPNSFLYAGPGTMGFGDPGLNVIQRYDVTRLKYKHGKLKARKRGRRGSPRRPAEHRAEDVPGLRQLRGRRDPEAAGRRKDLRRTARRSVLRRPRSDLRRDQRARGHRERGRGQG